MTGESNSRSSAEAMSDSKWCCCSESAGLSYQRLCWCLHL